MSQSENIGGRAYTNGVRLTDGSRTVKAYYNEDGFLQLEKGSVRRSQLFSKAKKIPVVRGIISIFLAIWMFLKESTSHPKKYWFVFVIILADILFLIWPAQSGTASVIFAAIYYVFPVVLLILFWNKIGEVLKYHGAEHKAVNYYENNYEGKISDYSRLHRRCGSNLVFFYIIISFAAGFVYIPLNAWLLELLYLGTAYELMRYTPSNLLIITTLFQRLVTREPEPRHLQAAEKALEVLVEGKV